MTRTIHLGYFPWQIHFPSSHYSTIKHGFSYSTKRLPVRAFTIRGPLWSSSIFTSYQPWKNNNESYLHQTLLGPLPKTLCYGSFFKGWHQWQPTLINNLPLWHWWQQSNAKLKLCHAILNSYHSYSPWKHASIICIYVTISPPRTMPLSSASDESLPLCNEWKRYLSIRGYSPWQTVLLWCFLVYI